MSFMATTASMASAAGVIFIPRATTKTTTTRFSALPCLPSPRAIKNVSVKTEYRRFMQLRARSSSSDETPGELLADLKEKWDAIEDKTTVLLYGGGAIVAVWLASAVVGAINSVPLIPKLMELVGVGYTGWFVYRYLLFKQSRKELAEDIEEVKKKISGE